MEKQIKFFGVAGFCLPAINATVFNNSYHCEILGKPIITIAKNRKKVSDTARPDKIDENEFRNFKSTLSDNRVPKIPKIEMDVSVTPSR